MTWLVLALVAGVAAADPPDPADALWSLEPSVTGDGSRIVVPVEGEDGARGAANLSIQVWTRRAALASTHVVQTVDQCTEGPSCAPATIAQVERQERAAGRFLDQLRRARGLHAMAQVQPTTRTATELVAPELRISLSPAGTLTVTPRGRRAITRRSSAWRTEPTVEQRREQQRDIEQGGLGCYNPAELGDVWIDARRRAVVVEIRYHGNDSCWEPDSDRAVITW